MNERLKERERGGWGGGIFETARTMNRIKRLSLRHKISPRFCSYQLLNLPCNIHIRMSRSGCIHDCMWSHMEPSFDQIGQNLTIPDRRLMSALSLRDTQILMAKPSIMLPGVKKSIYRSLLSGWEGWHYTHLCH